MRQTVLLVLMVFGLVGCVGSAIKPGARIVVDWSIVAPDAEVTALQVNEEVIKTDTNRKFAYANTPVQSMLINLVAWLHGRDDPNPEFTFDVASEKPIPYSQERRDLLVIEPTQSTKGTVRVTYENLETLVPFIIFPSAFLAYRPEQYSWAQGDIGPGIIFSTGELVDPASADLYVEQNGEMVAPYGFVKIPMRDPYHGGMMAEVNATEHEFQPGPLGIATPTQGVADWAIPNLWLIKTRDGYARMAFIFQRGFTDWGIVYEYSPNGIFQAY